MVRSRSLPFSTIQLRQLFIWYWVLYIIHIPKEKAAMKEIFARSRKLLDHGRPKIEAIISGL